MSKMQTRRGRGVGVMGTNLNPNQIHGKKIISVAGVDIFGKSIISVVNSELNDKGYLVIGINIKEDDFDFFISNLPASKVETTIFMPEFQKKAAEFFNKDGFAICGYKKAGEFVLLTDDEQKYFDDRELINIIKEVEGIE